MKIFKHMIEQAFVIATGIAALLHSTWSLGTLFSGEQPSVENISTMIQFVHFLGWFLPAFLLAIALDIGQIATSHEIRVNGVTKGRVITFAVLALSTYYLQWLYIVYHIPQLTVGLGVTEYHQGLVDLIRNAAIWVIPLFLPLATTLHTITGNKQEKPRRKQHKSIQSETVDFMPFMPIVDNPHVAICHCGWESDEKESAGKAAMALAAHKRHCVG